MSLPKLPESIFRITRESEGLSLRELASKANISKSAIIRTEQALYSTPAQALIDFFHLNPQVALRAYEIQQKRTRLYHGPKPKGIVYKQDSEGNPVRVDMSGAGVDSYFHPPLIREFMTMNTDILRAQHPMEYLLDGRSYLSFAKAFCVPPDVLRRWIEEPWQVKTVPSSITGALDDSGYDRRFINFLRHSYITIYKRRERCGQWCIVCYPVAGGVAVR